MDKTNSNRKIKTALLYATIVVLVIAAIVAIFMIFFGSANTLWQIMGTLIILYLITLLSVHNMSRLNQPHAITRICAIMALSFNLLWGIPWILIIWGAFGDNYALLETVWRLVWTALIIAGYFTLLSTQLPQPPTWRGLVKVQQSVPLVLVSYVMINALVFVWTIDPASSVNLIFKLACAELILILLQWAIPEILIRNQHKQQSPSVPPSSNSTVEAPSVQSQSSSSSDESAPSQNSLGGKQDSSTSADDQATTTPPQVVIESDDPDPTDDSSQS